MMTPVPDNRQNSNAYASEIKSHVNSHYFRGFEFMKNVVERNPIFIGKSDSGKGGSLAGPKNEILVDKNTKRLVIEKFSFKIEKVLGRLYCPKSHFYWGVQKERKIK